MREESGTGESKDRAIEDTIGKEIDKEIDREIEVEGGIEAEEDITITITTTTTAAITTKDKDIPKLILNQNHNQFLLNNKTSHRHVNPRTRA